MAIRIPSKNIYEMNNPKIRNNVVDNVSVEQTIVKPNNEYEVSIYNEKFYGFELSTSSSDLAIASVAEQSSGSYWEAISYVRVTPKYKKNIEIVINALKNNYFVSKVYDGEKTNEDGTKEANIKYSIEYRKYSGDITGTATLNKAINPYESESRVIENSPYNITEQQNVGEIPKLKQTNENSFSRNGYVGNNKALAEITEISDETNLANIKLNLENNIYISKDTATILSGIEIIKLGNVINNADVGELGLTRNLTGSYEKYEPLSIEITIYGNTIGIDLTDGSVTYGSGNKPFSLPRNELLQDSGLVEGVKISQKLADNVLAKYKNGKETATLLCDIADYYDENGQKAIDIKTENMSFRLHDEVIPMIYGANGKDKPMSTKKDGTPKVFEVVGSKILYDGAVWQELTLQEIT